MLGRLERTFMERAGPITRQSRPSIYVCFLHGRTDMVDVEVAAAALLGRGESGWSEKGEKADIRELDGLKPIEARTAIIVEGGLSGSGPAVR